MYAVAIGPQFHGFAGELRTIVDRDGQRRSTLLDDLVQCRCYFLAVQRYHLGPAARRGPTVRAVVGHAPCVVWYARSGLLPCTSDRSSSRSRSTPRASITPSIADSHIEPGFRPVPA